MEQVSIRAMSRLSLWLAMWILGAGCGGRANVECAVDSNCDLMGGGICKQSAAGGHWCAYPDTGCPSGYSYSNENVGDGVSGSCVAESAPAIDAGQNPDVGSTVPISCAALPTGCGTNGNDSCCSSPAVSGGTYFRSYDVAQDSLSGDKNSPASVSDFHLDKYEVTVGRFRAFVVSEKGTQANAPVANAGAHANIAGSGWQASWNTSLAMDSLALAAALKCDTFATWTDMPAANEQKSINCVTWYEAMAFCAWDGGYPPTEAEWNYAATGGDDQRVYPWSAPDHGSLAIDGTRASYGCLGDGTAGCATTDLVNVGTKTESAGRWGQMDLGGNVAEWMLDLSDVYVSPCRDCANLASGTARVFRGGGFADNATQLRSGYRFHEADPIDRKVFRGFRCARP